MKTAHISLITSLYRSENHLQRFINHAVEVSKNVMSAGLTLELIPVVNDVTPQERQMIEELTQRAAHVKPVFVPRETLYASWNRGLGQASGQVIGFWNVDDVRTAQALVDGYERIQQGCELVYFPYTVIRPNAYFYRERVYPAVPFTIEAHRTAMKCGPFFLFTPSLYEKVGIFDERFRIVGDWEWCIRALEHTPFCPSPVSGGTFYLHGGNLSSSGNPLQTAEENVLFILHSMWDALTPADPKTMRETWLKWADTHELPLEVAENLWGAGSQSRWEQWQNQRLHERRRAEWEKMLRFLPKKLIDATGLRTYLAKLGIVKARK